MRIPVPVALLSTWFHPAQNALSRVNAAVVIRSMWESRAVAQAESFSGEGEKILPQAPEGHDLQGRVTLDHRPPF